MDKVYDILSFGRSSIDLYSNDIGTPFEDITSFGAFVGGSATNIAVAANRLGLKTVLLTAFGEDQVGKFLKKFLDNEGIITDYIPVLPGKRSSAVVLGIEPPDRFPLVYYRDNCADIEVGIDHVLQSPISQCKALILSGTALSKDPSRTATFFAAEVAHKANTEVLLDLDFRADQWYDPRAYGITVRALLPQVKIAIGTEEEILAAMLSDRKQVSIKHQQISAPEVQGNIQEAIEAIMNLGVETLVVKRGAAGASYYHQSSTEHIVPGFPVEVLNVLGAGDAFCRRFSLWLFQGLEYIPGLPHGQRLWRYPGTETWLRQLYAHLSGSIGIHHPIWRLISRCL